MRIGVRPPFKGVLVGIYDNADRLTEVGSVDAALPAPDLRKRLAYIGRRAIPFAIGDPPWQHAQRVDPTVWAQAEFQKWTASGKIRHASFRGLRDDKEAGEVRRERAE